MAARQPEVCTNCARWQNGAFPAGRNRHGSRTRFGRSYACACASSAVWSSLRVRRRRRRIPRAGSLPPDSASRRPDAAGSAISRVVSFALRRGLRGRARHRAPCTPIRSRAVCRGQSRQRRQSRSASGSRTDGRTAAREEMLAAVVVRRRPHVGDLDGGVLALHRRQHCGNGGDYERATDPWVAIGPDGIAYQIGHRLLRRRQCARIRERHPRQPIARRRAQLGEPGHADPRRPRTISTTRIRSPPIRPTRRLRVCRSGTGFRPRDMGPRIFSRTTDGGIDVGSAASRSTIRDPRARRSTIRSSC